jgi:Tfp pilus assembly protein FimT
MKSLSQERGASLVEFLVAMTVFISILASITSLFFNSYIGSQQSIDRSQAVFLAQEATEAVRSIRDDDFDNLVVGTHGLSLSQGRWVLFGSYDDLDKFRREVEISQIEVGLKKVAVAVSWEISSGRSGLVNLTEYLADYRSLVE